MDRDALSTVLRGYFETQEDILVAYLFGSVTRGEQSSRSDVDVGVLFTGSQDQEALLYRRIGMVQELEELVSRPVDVADLGRTPPHFNHQVLRHGIVLKGQTSAARIEFEKDVRRQYFDLLPYRQRYLDASLRRLREGGPSGGAGGADTGTLEAAGRIRRRLAGSSSRNRSD